MFRGLTDKELIFRTRNAVVADGALELKGLSLELASRLENRTVTLDFFDEANRKTDRVKKPVQRKLFGEKS